MRTARLLSVSPSMHCIGGVSVPEGVSGSRGVPGPGEVPALRGCLLWGGAWSWGVPAPEGGCLLWVGGVGGLLSQHALRQTPSCEQND